MDFMRELQECQAEVFRRSEKKIKARKRRRKAALAMCVPLCLVLGLWSVMHDKGIGVNDAVEDQVETIVMDTNSIILSDSMVEVQDSGWYYEKITDSAVVFCVSATMDDLFAESDDAVMPEREVSENDFSHIADSTRSIGYSITLTDVHGNRRVYHLSENILTNTETNETVTLTGAELLQLKADLGIAD